MSEGERTAGNDQEFSLLVHRRHRFVVQVAHALLRNAHDAEDIAQETFLKLYRSGRWRSMHDERAFLARTAWRMALDLHRSRRAATEDLDTETLPSQTGSPEQHAVRNGNAALLHRMIDALPEELRQPLVLSGIDEMTSPEIAAILNMPEGTVRTRLLRARQLLKQKLERAGYRKESR